MTEKKLFLSKIIKKLKSKTPKPFKIKTCDKNYGLLDTSNSLSGLSSSVLTVK